MYRKNHSIYRVQYYPLLQASTGGLGKYPLWIRGDYFIHMQHMLDDKVISHRDMGNSS